MQSGRVFAVLLLTGGAFAAPPPVNLQVAGTYSNLHYNKEGGDLLGLEIKIVPVAGGRYQGAIQVSDGEPAPMAIVNVQVAGRSVSFTVPDGSEPSWSFKGTVSSKSLQGTITYSSGARRTVILRRGCGYWER